MVDLGLKRVHANVRRGLGAPRCGWSPWLLLAAGCAGPASVEPARVPSTDGPTTPAAESTFGADVRIVEAVGQNLEFPLPDAAGWRLDARETRSWVAYHPRSSSRLLVRAWQFDGVARPEDCERQARLWRRDLPQFPPEDVVHSAEQTLAGGYHGRVTLGVRAGPPPASHLFGHVLAIGSDARHCLLLAFSTMASGPGARRLLGERLAAATQHVFRGARRLGLQERILVPRP